MKITQGGIELRDRKKELSLGSTKIKPARLPQSVVIPVSQHQGRAASPVVGEGDRVRIGTLIAEPEGFLSSSVHASVSGIVEKIDLFPHPVLGEALAIQIISDGKDERDPSMGERAASLSLNREELIQVLHESGIVGLGGAGFPTHAKLNQERSIETILINGIECEPYLTCDYVNLMERPHDFIRGAAIVTRALEAKRCVLVVDEEQIEALELVRSKLLAYPATSLETVALPDLYPQGDERRLIRIVLRKEVPQGARPADIGIAVLNVGTILAIYEAVRFGKPLYERVVTVSGECLVRPQNLLVRIGTLFEDVIRQCGGFLRSPGRVVMGGPMMGVAQERLDLPVIKTTQAILALAPEITKVEPIEPCIRCGYCITACPIQLNPSTITLAAERGRFDLALEFGVTSCVECGNCSYVCPSKRPMVEILQYAKQMVRSSTAGEDVDVAPAFHPIALHSGTDPTLVE